MTDAVLTAAEMRAAEQALIDAGVSVDELMQRAGSGAAEWLWRVAAGRSITVLCGPGNNGGDGYVIAETVRGRGLPVRVVAPLEPTTDAARNARAAWRGETATSGEGVRGVVLVDCLFGSGLSRPLSDDLAALLTGLAERHDVTVAVDLPSGVATDTGALLGPAPDCALTLALGAWKPAHFLMPAMARMDRRELVPIGVDSPAGAPQLLSRPPMAAPGPADHKFTRGLVVVVGGPLSGASQLACAAALRAGAGAVRLSARVVHPAMPPDIVLRDDPLDELLSDKRTSAVLIGPGLGRDERAREALAIALGAGFPMVLDADALRLLGESDLAPLAGRAILTPHEGELAQLCETFAVEARDKPARARDLAAKAGAVVVAKGPDTLIAAPDGRLAFAPSTSSWLSVAGSGDVLAGAVASRLAVTGDPFAAASEGHWLHSEAARLLGPAFTASDLAAALPRALAAAL
jgi:hydroxyethylthiazole kinase-like uncharacterized protein yjeF